MSLNWVMLAETGGFVLLPDEHIVYTSPPRTTLSLRSPSGYPGKQPLSISSSAGTAYLTNSRVVYLPSKPTSSLASFSASVLNLHDTHVSAPFFGPNTWSAVVQPVAGGGIPARHSLVEMRMTFKDGGSFDFQSEFEKVKEQVQHALDLARESGQTPGQGGVDLTSVHLEQLPAYEEANGTAPAAAPAAEAAPSSPLLLRPETAPSDGGDAPNSDGGSRLEPKRGERAPSGPPPGYEEAQRDGVADMFERRMREGGQGRDRERDNP
ncbi:MAG: hypothetical protein M1832_005142 [Thelocarpon impressellum]|nr:MAG: hypothetical protein M1832_005142 [Thelocarpon impressellum]